MSTLLEQASLVMIPSGYKEDVVYSQIPTNGNGDLSFTRASNGTRINSAGLVEVCPWNLAQQSETFDNAIWSKSLTTIVANSLTAPNGTLTADKIFPTSSGSVRNIVQNTGISLNNCTGSIYAKWDGGTVPVLGITYGVSPNIVFNLETQEILTTAGITATMTSVGDGWYRCVWDYVSTTDTRFYMFLTNTTTLNFNVTANGNDGIYIWGAQLNIGSTAKPYFPTTDRLNVPRLTYQNGGGGCPSLLLEPQRTNLLTYSEQLDNAAWSKYLATVTANNATSPDGTQNADLVYPSSTGTLAGQVFRQVTTGVSLGNVVTISAFVKASGKNFAYISEITGSFSPAAYFNLSTGAITNISAGVTASMTDFSNGWWRISITSTAGVGLYYTVIGSTDSAGSNVNTASSTNGILVWGAQCEVGAYPTTYIPTTTASATRVADAFSRNNIYTNGLITSSGGTWFVELLNNLSLTRDASDVGLFIGNSSNGTSGDVLAIRNNGTGRLAITKRVSGTQTGLYDTTTDTTKVAIKWNGSTADVFVNGTKVVSATSFAATNMEFLNGLGADVTKFISQMDLFPTPLTDAECIALTTL